jgi:glycosyltransferase involved in cell wall biosynthesis
MNRLHHLQQTLPQNIKDNASYPFVEFILLDYNSTDGLEDWVKENLSVELTSGKLRYFKTTDPSYFNRSHSRNMAFLQATGDILCNVDADNYTGPDFANYINDCFQEDSSIFLVSAFNEELLEFKDAYGRVCMWRDDFYSIGGYDESMESYGHEDTDLYDRLTRLGRKEKNITDIKYLNSIAHDDKQRTGNEFFIRNLDRFYLAYENQSTRVLFLFKNNMFEMGTLIDNHYSLPSPSSIKEGRWIKGRWEESLPFLRLYINGEVHPEILSTNNLGINYVPHAGTLPNHLIYSKITNPTLLYNTLLSYSIITNSNQIHWNETNGIVQVNPNGFGKGSIKELFVYA